MHLNIGRSESSKILPMKFELIDFLIIGVYFLVVFFVGFYFSRKERNATDYFLAGRHISWYAIGASLFASNISSEHFIGLAGSGYQSGLAVGNFEWMACFVVLLLAWFFVPFYLRSGVFTMPEFLEKRFNSHSRWILTSVSIIAYVLTKVSVTLLAGGILLRELVGWDLYTSSMVLVIATGMYTVAGGLTAVIYTELFQTVVLIGGALLLTIFGISEVGGIDNLINHPNISDQHFSLFRNSSHEEFPWTGILFGAPIIGIWYWCTDQFIVQRVLSARNLNHARSGSIFAGYLKILPVFILILPGVIARALYPDIQPNDAYSTMVANLLPTGIRGLVIASLLAALMSSLASCFNSTSTLFTIDVYKKLKPKAPETSLVNVGRVATFVIVILAILWVPFIEGFSDQLYIYLQKVQSYIAPPITAIFLGGLLWSRANGAAAVLVLILGLVVGAGRFILEIIHASLITSTGTGFDTEWLNVLVNINFLHFTILMFLFSVSTLFVISLLGPKPELSKIEGFTINYCKKYTNVDENIVKESLFWKKINIIATGILVLIILFLWISFK